MKRWVVTLGILGSMLAHQQAYAADIQDQASAVQDQVASVRTSVWIFELGGYGLFEPTYEGSKHYQFAFKPIADISAPGDRIWYSFPNDAITYDLVEGPNYRFGPAASITLQSRRHGEDVDLTLGRSEADLQFGAFAEYYPLSVVRTRVEVLQTAVGSTGFTADLSADYLWKATPKLMLTFGPRVRFVDDTYASNYFSTRVAGDNGTYVPYKAEGGLHWVGSEMTSTYNWTDKLSTKFYFDYNRIFGDAADSPRVNLHGTTDQVTIGIGTSYKFSVAP